MSLQGRKKWVKRNGEREIVYSVYKFMKSESQVGITIPLPKCRRELLKQHVLLEELYIGYWNKVKMWKNIVTMAFSTPQKLSPKVCTKTVLDNFNEAVLRRIVHNFTSLRNNNQLWRQSTAKCANPLVAEEVYPHCDWCWEKWDLGKFHSLNKCVLWILALCQDSLYILNFSYMLPLNIYVSILENFVL